MPRRTILLVQLPLPRPGLAPAEANVPLAAACLKLYASRQGLDRTCAIDLLPPAVTNEWGDQGVVEAILARRPSLVGFTCYLWNIDRTLWIAARLKERDAAIRIVLGGPEITADNDWVLAHPAVDYAVLGEGEQTFASLLADASQTTSSGRPVVLPKGGPTLLPNLDAAWSPYLEGILDVGPGETMFLETARGCPCRCKFCYYPKSYRRQHFLSPEQIAANVRYAAERGASEVFLLDPTLNHRPDFAGFLRLLAHGNPGRRFSYSGELRAERIDAAEARLLAEAGVAEVEVGLQSVDPHTQTLMGRRIDLGAFARGARLLKDEGIRVRTDLILGLPGDTADSVRRGIDFLLASQAFTEAQVFNLSVLPGTAFRQEAAALGLTYQERPPYYVLQTPTLDLEAMYDLAAEAQEAFGVEFDPLPPPQLTFDERAGGPVRRMTVDLDGNATLPVPPQRRAQATALWLRSADFDARRQAAERLIDQALADNPHTTLDVVLEPTAHVSRPSIATLERLLAACYRQPSYLDRYYSLHPAGRRGAKRLVVLLAADRARLDPAWLDAAEEIATLV